MPRYATFALNRQAGNSVVGALAALALAGAIAGGLTTMLGHRVTEVTSLGHRQDYRNIRQIIEDGVSCSKTLESLTPPINCSAPVAVTLKRTNGESVFPHDTARRWNIAAACIGTRIVVSLTPRGGNAELAPPTSDLFARKKPLCGRFIEITNGDDFVPVTCVRANAAYCTMNTSLDDLCTSEGFDFAEGSCRGLSGSEVVEGKVASNRPGGRRGWRTTCASQLPSGLVLPTHVRCGRLP